MKKIAIRLTPEDAETFESSELLAYDASLVIPNVESTNTELEVLVIKRIADRLHFDKTRFNSRFYYLGQAEENYFIAPR